MLSSKHITHLYQTFQTSWTAQLVAIRNLRITYVQIVTLRLVESTNEQQGSRESSKFFKAMGALAGP